MRVFLTTSTLALLVWKSLIALMHIPASAIAGGIVDAFRVVFYTYVYACDAFNRFIIGFFNLYDEFKRPIVDEFGRFMTILRPEPVVWYSDVCLGRFSNLMRERVSGFVDTLGRVYSPDEYEVPYTPSRRATFLDEVSRYAHNSSYRRQVCVLFTSLDDILVLIVLFTVTCVICAVGWAWLRRGLKLDDPVGRYWPSSLLQKLIRYTRQSIYDSSTIRSIFTRSPTVQAKEAMNHSHPISAAVRSTGVATIELICKTLGLEPYFVQRCASDVRHNRSGCRSFYWGKDVNVEPTPFLPPSGAALVMIDVDMYMDMPNVLANHYRPYFINTFQPRCVAGSSGEFSFTFDENNVCTYEVSGGAKYVHPVWNYSGDIYVVSARVWAGFAVRTCVYNVDRRQIDDHHQIICLTPMRTFVSPLIDLSFLLGAAKLERLSVAGSGFLRMRIKTSNDTLVSTGVVGRHACATITACQDDTIASVARLGKTEISPAGVKQIIPDLSSEEAAVLVAFHRKCVFYTADTVYPVSESVHNYQFDPKSYEPDAKLGMVPFMSPVLDDCYVPVKCRSNDAATVEGRILDVKPSDDLEITPYDLQVMSEFVEFLVPSDMAGTGTPVEIDEVYERQPRPTQQKILDEAVMCPDLSVDDEISCFQKAEAYSEVKDPRNISTIPGVNKLNYSSYMYPFVDNVLKKMPWYAFGLTPVEISRRVVAVCENASSVNNTDLSRMDGRVSKILRLLESMYMQRWVRPDYSGRLAELQATQHNQRARTRFGVKFDTAFSRLSGSPETSPFNTIDNAFMAYKTFRGTRLHGEFYAPGEAWNKLGIYGGDDGLTPDADPQVYVKVCASVGQKLKISISLRGDSTVTFLSRMYGPGVWYGDPNSMCDVHRQLSKLHVTGNLPPDVSPINKLGEKLTGFYLSDKNTPIIGELCVAFVNKFGLSELTHGLANYFSTHPDSVQFPNDDEGWMDDKVAEQMPSFDRKLFSNWLLACESNPSLFLKPPVCVPSRADVHVVEKPVVINGDVYTPEVVVKRASFHVGEHYPTRAQQTDEEYHSNVLGEEAYDASSAEYSDGYGYEIPIETEDLDNAREAEEAKREISEVPVAKETEIISTPEKPIVIVCKHIVEGKCKYGDKCNHLVKKQKCYGTTCTFVHGTIGICKFGDSCKRVGCTFTHKKDVPAPRLVGVEPNPGPSSSKLLCGLFILLFVCQRFVNGEDVVVDTHALNLGVRSSFDNFTESCCFKSMPRKGKKNNKVVAMVPAGWGTVPKANKKKSKKRKSGRRKRGGLAGVSSAISAAGAAYLKCTMAPADFRAGGTGFVGIPDEFSGPIVTKEWRYVGSLPTYTAGNDVYIIQLPVPGVAYFWGQRAAGSTTGTMTLTAVPYNNAGTYFPVATSTTGEDLNVTSFRYASNVIEIIPTVNEMTWGGSIQVWKSDIRMVESFVADNTVYSTYKYMGGMATLASSEPNGVFAFKDGLYAPAYNKDATYDWTPVMVNGTWADLNTNQQTANSVYDALLTWTNPGGLNFVGLGTFEATIIKLPALPASQTAAVRAWSCQEYQVSPLSNMYDFVHASPASDPRALALLKEYVKTIPAGVPWKDNANFWNTFLDWVRKGAKVASHLPGPVGAIGGGITSIMELGHGLY